MRDYLAMRPKRELQHAASNPIAEAFGEDAASMTVEEYLATVPADQLESVIAKLTEIIFTEAFNGPMAHALVPDYLAIVEPEEGDAVQYGVRGMKWGRRRTDAAITADNARRAEAGKPVTHTKKAEETHVKPGESETPQQRYSRLASVAKGGGTSSLSDEDLKFFNSRTEAMKKVDKMFEEQPTWLRSTTNDIARNVAKQQMQAVAGAIATKYISARIQEGLTQAQAKQQQAAIKAGIQKGLEEAAKKAEISKSTNKIPIGFTAPVKK
jgi:hypothetical protein